MSIRRQIFQFLVGVSVPHKLRLAARRAREARTLRLQHQAARDQLVRVAGELSDQSLADIRSLEQWQHHRPELHRQLLTMLGLNPLPQRSPLDAEITGIVEKEAYRIEKLVFQSMPELWVTGNLYLPKNVTHPVPCILYLCGHRDHACGAKTQYQDRYLWYPAHGFACLVLDPLQYGEVPGLHHGTQGQNRWDWVSLGYTPAGVEIWNAMRGVDYLSGRPEIDSTRIGVTGISGGGVMSTFLAAVDDRIRVAAPSCSAYAIGDQAAKDLVGYQCDCTFLPNFHQIDFSAVAALIAPRPLLVASGRRDRIFPPAGVHGFFRKVRRIYDLHNPGGSDRIRAIESGAGHTDTPAMLRETREWMCRWLHPDPPWVLADAGRDSPPSLPPETLACLKTPPASARNYSIDRQFIAGHAVSSPGSAEAWRCRRGEILETLKKTTFAWLPSAAGPVEHCRCSRKTGGGSRIAENSQWRLESEPGVFVNVRRYQPATAQPSPSWLIVVRSVGDCVGGLDDEWLPLLARHGVIELRPRFSERPMPAIEHAALERTAVLCGRTIAAMQVWDLMKTVQWTTGFARVPPGRIALYGRGCAGMIALHAALLLPEIHHVILRDPPDSYRAGPPLLAALRATDFPEVAAAMAPRRLSLLSDPPASFAWVRQVYDLLGAGDRFRQFPDLYSAVMSSCSGNEMAAVGEGT